MCRYDASVEVAIRGLSADELILYLAALELGAGRHADPSSVRDGVVDRPECQRLAAFDGHLIVGGTAYDTLELTLPGLSLTSAARIMLTAVLPTHRRAGIALALMRQQLMDIRDAGFALAVLTTSGAGLYDRLGYSPTSGVVSVRCKTRSGALRNQPTCPVHLGDSMKAPDLLPRLFDAHRQTQPGQVSRSGSFWQAWFRDRELYRPLGSSERFLALAGNEMVGHRGYVTYRLRYGELREQPVQEIIVEDLIAIDDDARLALWDFCLGFEQAPLLSAVHVPTDEPVIWALRDVRSVNIETMRDFLWLRLVDVRRALCARGYDVTAELVLRVYDPVIRSNDGRFLISTVAGGPASCEPSKSCVDISLDISALATVYFGANTFTALARAGRVKAASAAALRRADLLFQSAPAPWTVMDW